MLIIAQVLFWLALAFVAGHVVAIACFDRPKGSRVDWNTVYTMERNIWGQTFEHLGAPAPQHPVIVNSPPTGISTHYELSRFGIASPTELHRAAAYLTRNEQRERETARWEIDKESVREACAYMTNDEVEKVFRRGY